MVECVKSAKGILGSKEKPHKFNLMSKQLRIKNIEVFTIELKHPITGKPTDEHLEIHQNDFENKMDWHQAKKACEELGNTWRLPTKSEIELIYADLMQNGNANFKMYYFSSRIMMDTIEKRLGMSIRCIKF